MLKGRTWVLDGGLGSTLNKEGIHLSRHPLWSAWLLHTKPEAIKEVHRSFLEVGAEILITSSYQASVPGFEQHLNLSEEAALDLITLSVTLAREACQEYFDKEGKKGPLLVAGSVGPYGACQADGSEYNGKYIDQITPNQLQDWHRPRMKALVAAGVDLLAIETIPAAKEAYTILELLREFPDTKAWVSFSCKDGEHTNYGDKFGEAVQGCYERGGDQLVGVGVNCSPPQHLPALLGQVNDASGVPGPKELPRVVYPNSGEAWVAGKGWEGRSVKWSYTEQVREWHQQGASVIGGCCRLGPSDIQAIADILASLS